MDMTYDPQALAGYMTNWAGRLFVRALERRLGSGAGPMPVCFALQDGTALPQKELARIAAVEQPTMAATLARMERDGLIRRTPDPADRRSALVSLTAQGRRRADAALEAARAVNAVAMGSLSPSERQQFFAIMRKIIAALDADENDGT
jgi:MarR family transcriptional regulator, transcriptional regulator for hemolysin